MAKLLMFCLGALIYADVKLQTITVKEGETLWSIANYYLKDPRAWPEILKYNKLPSSDPNVVLPGMKLKVPILLIKEELRIAADLIYILNRVDYRKRKEFEWKRAKLNMKLYNEDALKTFTKSLASVKFISGEVAKISENSFVIIKPRKKRDEIVLRSGRIRASKSKLIVGSATVEPKVKNSDYSARLEPDKTALIEVYRGVVDVTSKGKTVTLKEGFGTIVRYLEVPSLPVKLPEMPKISSDLKVGDVYLTKNQTLLKIPKLVFKKEIKGSKSRTKIVGGMRRKYVLQISMDKAFKKILVEEKRDIEEKLDIDFKKYNLKDGEYYYRVACIDEIGFRGKFSHPLKFIVDTTPPKIEIYQPKDSEKIAGDFAHIKGKTEKNVYLKINKKEVEVNEDGTFLTSIFLKKGENTISIFARDPAGNTSETSLRVFGIKKGKKLVKKEEPKIKEVKIERKSIDVEKEIKKVKKKGTYVLGLVSAVLSLSVIFGVIYFILK